MKLLDLLGDGRKEIITREDHRYGINTTRGTPAIYKVRGNAVFRVFGHNLADKTHMPGGNPDEPKYREIKRR